MYLPLFVGVLCSSLFWYALLYILSDFAIILTRKRELVARFYCPHGAVGGSAVCNFILTYFLTEG